MAPIKIAVAGEIRSGKDTVCEYIQEKVPGMQKLYFAGGIQKVIELCFPEAFAEGKPRKLYQEIGTFMRSIDQDVWVNYVKKELDFYQDLIEIENFIVTDLRQPNEYDWLKSEGFTVIKVEANDEIRIERMKASGDVFEAESLVHPVEQLIKALPYDYLITNNDTLESLYEQVDYVLKDLKGGA